MTDTAIHVEHVWKKFRRGEMHDSLRDLIPAMAKRALGKGPKGELTDREFWALRDVSFDVKKGESLGIIGPNGAGKSTLLKLLSRIIRPNKGHYFVNGRLSALIEVGAGFHADLTGRENILLNGTILGMKRNEIRAKMDRIIDFAGVSEFIDTPVKRYSSGMTARLGFAVAAHLDPDVLLVDEVLSVGDAKFRNRCINHMCELMKSDVTVIFISHLLSQVRWLCPQTLVLDHGKPVFHGKTDEAIRVYLDLLSDGPGSDDDPNPDAEARNFRLCDLDGNERIHWDATKPTAVEFDLVLHRDFDCPSILMNLKTVSDIYIGTANSLRNGVTLPGTAGTHRVKFIMDPMPLSDGDYTLELVVRDGEDQSDLIWKARQPHAFTVEGAGCLGTIVTCNGQWDVTAEEKQTTKTQRSQRSIAVRDN